MPAQISLHLWPVEHLDRTRSLRSRSSQGGPVRRQESRNTRNSASTACSSTMTTWCPPTSISADHEGRRQGQEDARQRGAVLRVHRPAACGSTPRPSTAPTPPTAPATASMPSNAPSGPSTSPTPSAAGIWCCGWRAKGPTSARRNVHHRGGPNRRCGQRDARARSAHPHFGGDEAERADGPGVLPDGRATSWGWSIARPIRSASAC